MNPGPFTWRELVWMAEGRQRSEWEQTAKLIAEVKNMANSGPPFQPWQFNPFELAERERRRATMLPDTLPIGAMRQAFVDSGKIVRVKATKGKGKQE